MKAKMTKQQFEHSKMYQAIGEVVASSQMFEFAFVAAAKLIYKQSDIQSFDDIERLSLSRSFKQPAMSVLKEIGGLGLDETLYMRIEGAIEARHKIVHRTIISGDIAAFCGEETKVRMHTEFCLKTTEELKALTIELMDNLITWLGKYPETAELYKKHSASLQEIRNMCRSEN